MLSKQIQQTIIKDSSNFTHFKPEFEVLGFIPSRNSVHQSRVIDDEDKKEDEVPLGIDQEEEEKKKEMVISEGFHVYSVGSSNDESSSVLMVEMNNKENFQEPISQIQNVVEKNQEPVGKELDDSFIAEQMKETQEEIYSKDSAKEEVCQVHSLPPSMSQYENVVVKMMNSESSNNIYAESKQDEVFQLKDVVTGDQHLILVVETTQDDFIKSNSISPSQNLVEMSSNWGELSASGSNNKRMSAEIGSTRIVSGYGCARKETMSSIDLGKKRAGICSENIRQPRRRFTEANSKKDVLSMFIEARNIFCQKKLDGNKRSYSREEMEALRFENSYQQRQIWREIYTGLGPVVAKQLNQLSDARQNGKAMTDQQQQQQHYHPQLHHQHPRQHQQHHRYPLQPLQHHQYSQQQQHYHPQPHHQHPRQYQEHQRYPLQSLQHHQYSQQQQQQHHQHPKKPPQHHHHHNHDQHQLAGVHRENTSILGAGTATARPVHLRINMKNTRTRCCVPYVHYIPVYYSCQMLVADFLSQLIIFVSQITNSKPNNFSPVNCLTATSLPDATTVTD
ncbi:activating signal cointegrator 1 complex subunit 2 homolog isoform X2 [Papaver somniferum]|uniref:activating signal cointegrator 1 complex subunit 2 homolog isoform X2 n=1 Tax=Papaver somniferum TaxID=3469 RepID=UPI000E6F61D3|nr:activating signal cointegrator 1 complex subunit 2 homolog isoform X2 [Papaver somniferum]